MRGIIQPVALKWKRAKENKMQQLIINLKCDWKSKEQKKKIGWQTKYEYLAALTYNHEHAIQ